MRKKEAELQTQIVRERKTIARESLPPLLFLTSTWERAVASKLHIRICEIEKNIDLQLVFAALFCFVEVFFASVSSEQLWLKNKRKEPWEQMAQVFNETLRS